MSAPSWATNLAVFDTETTGVDVETARVVTAAIAVLDSTGAVVERHDWVIDPLVEIPDAAAAVHGITTEIARATGVQPAVGIEQILAVLAGIFDRGIAVTAYNAPYDFTILAREAHRYGLAALDTPQPVIDPLVIDKQLDRYRRGKRTLTATIEHYGIEMVQAHDAGEDAIAAGRLAQKLAERFATELPEDVTELHKLQQAWAAAQAASFQEWMRKNNKPDFVADGEWPIRSAPTN
jgi:DNA polymerase-3 subunit epsilon